MNQIVWKRKIPLHITLKWVRTQREHFWSCLFFTHFIIAAASTTSCVLTWKWANVCMGSEDGEKRKISEMWENGNFHRQRKESFFFSETSCKLSCAVSHVVSSSSPYLIRCILALLVHHSTFRDIFTVHSGGAHTAAAHRLSWYWMRCRRLRHCGILAFSHRAKASWRCFRLKSNFCLVEREEGWEFKIWKFSLDTQQRRWEKWEFELAKVSFWHLEEETFIDKSSSFLFPALAKTFLCSFLPCSTRKLASLSPFFAVCAERGECQGKLRTTHSDLIWFNVSLFFLFPLRLNLFHCSG